VFMTFDERLRNVSVIGAAGKMGSGIALLLAQEMVKQRLKSEDGLQKYLKANKKVSHSLYVGIRAASLSYHNDPITGSSPSVGDQNASGAIKGGHSASQGGTGSRNANGSVKGVQNVSQSTTSSGNASAAGGGGDGTSKSSTSEDEGGGEDEASKQGLKPSKLGSLLKKVLEMMPYTISTIVANVIARLMLHWLGFR
jgi:hypothetical protein